MSVIHFGYPGKVQSMDRDVSHIEVQDCGIASEASYSRRLRCIVLREQFRGRAMKGRERESHEREREGEP